MKKALVILALQTVVLGAAIAVFVHGERKTSFPPTIAVPAGTETRASVVPVSIRAGGGSVGTTTAALSRGGKASADLGVAGHRSP